MHTRIGDSSHSNQTSGLRHGAARDARHAAVTAGDGREQAGAALGHLGVIRALDDGRERAVDIAEHGCLARHIGEGSQGLGKHFGGGSGHAP